MSTDSIIKQKSMAFARRVVMLYQYLQTEQREFVMAKQILRSGTSIGANVTEAADVTFWPSFKSLKKKRRKQFTGWIF